MSRRRRVWAGKSERARRARFERELVPHLVALHRFAHALGAAERADDLVQTTCERALERYDTYRTDQNLRAWLFTILRHESVSGHRRLRRERDLEDRVTALPPPAGEPSLEAVLAERRWSAEIRDALAALPETYRTPVYLKDVEGFPYRDVAAIIGCPIGTVMSRLSRGRGVLRAVLHRQAVERGLIHVERRRGSA